MPTEVVVYKAQRLTDRSEPTPDLVIRATEEFPDGQDLPAVARAHTLAGRALAEALFQCLPGGTVDALIASLFERRASLFAVRFE